MEGKISEKTRKMLQKQKTTKDNEDFLEFSTCYKLSKETSSTKDWRNIAACRREGSSKEYRREKWHFMNRSFRYPRTKMNWMWHPQWGGVLWNLLHQSFLNNHWFLILGFHKHWKKCRSFMLMKWRTFYNCEIEINTKQMWNIKWRREAEGKHFTSRYNLYLNYDKIIVCRVIKVLYCFKR